MSRWWYVESKKKKGPVETEDLNELLQAEKITINTMAWCKGMEDWRPICDIKELTALKAVIPPPIPVNGLESTDYKWAGAWRRFFARIFDVWWESLLTGLVSAYIAAQVIPGYYEWIMKPDSGYLFAFVTFPLIFIFDAIIHRLFGNTPGKALLGLKVKGSNGLPLSFKNYLGRNLRVYFSGFGMGVPLINLFTMGYQARRMGEGRHASYDEGKERGVYAKPISVLRRVFFVIAVFTLMITVAVFQQYDKKLSRNYQKTHAPKPAIAQIIIVTGTNPFSDPRNGDYSVEEIAKAIHEEDLYADYSLEEIMAAGYQMRGAAASSTSSVKPREMNWGAQKPERGISKKYALAVWPDPANATVRILNIKPKYYQGILLKPGRYKIEVSKTGFKTDSDWVEIVDSNLELTPILRKIYMNKSGGVDWQRTRVEAAHPRWENTVKTPVFHSWMQTQTEEVQALYRSKNTDDAIEVLDAYKTFTEKVAQ